MGKEKVTFVFEVNGIRVEKEITYPYKPTKKQIENDMQRWFFENHYMWFAIKKDGREINMADFPDVQ